VAASQRRFHPFLNATGQLRSGWWLFVYLFLVGAINLPLQGLLHARGITPTAPWQDAIVCFVLVLAAWPCQWLRRRPYSEIGLNPSRAWLAELLLGCVLGSLLMLLPAFALAIACGLRWQTNPEGIALVGSNLAQLLAAALGEELFCRGFLFQRLLDGLGMWPAQLIMAAFFVFTHWHNPGMTGATKVLASLNVFLASILFGLAFLRTRRLALPLGIHWFANWTQGGLLGLGVSGHATTGLLTPGTMSGPDWLTGGAFGLEASIPGLLCVLVMTLLLARYPPASSSAGMTLLTTSSHL